MADVTVVWVGMVAIVRDHCEQSDSSSSRHTQARVQARDSFLPAGNSAHLVVQSATLMYAWLSSMQVSVAKVQKVAQSLVTSAHTPLPSGPAWEQWSV
jgi:hypothetical protein